MAAMDLDEGFYESDNPHIDCTGLVVVCCHAIYDPQEGVYSDPYDERNWRLKSFQKSNEVTDKQGENHTFLQHAIAGVEQLQDPEILTILSGGKTDRGVDVSEAQSYLAALCSSRLFSTASYLNTRRLIETCGQRLAVEAFATDSYQNLLFSIIRFRKSVGRYPESILVVTHDFKRERFLRRHATAIGWPADRIDVLGIDPKWADEDEEISTKQSESKAMDQFQADPYGTGDVLGNKRTDRRWSPSSLDTLCEGLEPEVQDLLRWRGPDSFPGVLPWSNLPALPRQTPEIEEPAPEPPLESFDDFVQWPADERRTFSEV